MQEQYRINELEFVEQTKQEKFDVYATLRDHVVFLDGKNYKPKTITTRLSVAAGFGMCGFRSFHCESVISLNMKTTQCCFK